jgi:hypothetical protein
MTKLSKDETVVRVRCISCGDERDIHAGEIMPDDVPICKQCFMPMRAVHARSWQREKKP